MPRSGDFPQPDVAPLDTAGSALRG
jgi:hypothetical protein